MSKTAPWLKTFNITRKPVYYNDTNCSVLFCICFNFSSCHHKSVLACYRSKYLKVDYRSKSKMLHVHLYFKATAYQWNNALVEYIDNRHDHVIYLLYTQIVKNNIKLVSHKLRATWKLVNQILTFIVRYFKWGWFWCPWPFLP